MKINDIVNESTTSGSIATVATPMTTQKRSGVGKGVYGNEKPGNLLTGKKTNKKFANSISESKMKQVAMDLETMQDGNFKQKYGKTKEQLMKVLGAPANLRPKSKHEVNEAELGEILNVKLSKRDPSKETKWNRDGWPLIKQPSAEAHLGAAQYHDEQANKWKAQFRDSLKNPNLPEKGKEAYKWEIQRNNQEAKRHRLAAKNFNAVNEAHLEEDDLILVPGQGHKLKTGFHAFDPDKADHEGETVKNSLKTIVRHAKELHDRLENSDQFPEWVSEKIGTIKSMMGNVTDYLISKQTAESAGVIAAGGVGESLEHFDHEISMAKGDMRSAVKAAKRIYHMLDQRDELMAWQQSYITLASDYLDSVADAMEEEAHTGRGNN